MIKKSIFNLILVGSMAIPSGIIAEQSLVNSQVERTEQFKKALKVAGYGLLTFTGFGILGWLAGHSYAYAMKGNLVRPSDQEIKDAEGLARTALKVKRHFIKLESDEPEKVSDKISLGIGTSLIGAAGFGIFYAGIRGIKKTLYGQTEAEKEQDDKIVQAIKDTGKVTLDFSKRSARLAGYSILTSIGAVSFLISIGYGFKIGMNGFKKNAENYKEIVKEIWHEKPKELIASLIASPLGIGMMMVGIHGLIKEYHAWKEALAKPHLIDAAVQTDMDQVHENN